MVTSVEARNGGLPFVNSRLRAYEGMLSAWSGA